MAWHYFVASLVSRYQSNSRLADWQVFKRVKALPLWYCWLSLMLSMGDLKLRGYLKVEWDGDPNKSRSTLWHTFTFGGRTMSWCSKKQNCTTMSAMEADCVPCYHRIKKHCH